MESDIIDLLSKVDPNLKDIFLLSISRAENRPDYIDEIENPIFRGEALLHFDEFSESECIDIDKEFYLEYPQSTLLYLYGCDSIRKHMDLVDISDIDMIDLIAETVSYSASKNIFFYIFMPLWRKTRRIRLFTNFAIALDSVVFRYSIDTKLDFAIDAVKNFLLANLPTFLRIMFQSTILAFYTNRNVHKLHGEIISKIREGNRYVINRKVLPTIAKNLYAYGDKENFLGILRELLLYESKAKKHAPLYLISPVYTNIDALDELYTYNETISKLIILSRSKKFEEDKLALEFLDMLNKKYRNPLTAITKLRFLFRLKRSEVEISKEIFRAADKDKSVYMALGELYTYRYTPSKIKKVILEAVPNDKEALKLFVEGAYRETLRQYPLKRGNT